MARRDARTGAALANKARSALRGRDRRTAGIATVRHLDKARTALVAVGTATKEQGIAQQYTVASRFESEASQLRDLATRQRAAGQTGAAQDTEARANLAAERAASARRAAEILKAAPIAVKPPPEVSTERIAEVGAKFNLRVTRREAVGKGEYAAILSTLQGVGGVLGDEMVDFTDFAGAVDGYGGGAVGAALAAAEFGDVRGFETALADLRQVTGLESISLSGLSNLKGYCDTPPQKSPLDIGGVIYMGRKATWDTYCGAAGQIQSATGINIGAAPSSGLAQQEGDGKVYYIEAKKRYHVPNEGVASAFFGSGWGTLVKKVGKGVLNALPEAPWDQSPPAVKYRAERAQAQIAPSAPPVKTEMAQPTVVDIPQVIGPLPSAPPVKKGLSTGMMIGIGAGALGLGFLLLRRKA